jgi:hypothetical protein
MLIWAMSVSVYKVWIQTHCGTFIHKLELAFVLNFDTDNRVSVKMHLFTHILPTILLATHASAHGAVTSYEIGGTKYPGSVHPSIHPFIHTILTLLLFRYTGFSPASSPKTIQRQWPDYNPTMTITDKKVMCNGGTSAELSAKIAAGSKIKAIWSQWTHEQGPVMVWMYKCSGAFSGCDGSGKKWFKVSYTLLPICEDISPAYSVLAK